MQDTGARHAMAEELGHDPRTQGEVVCRFCGSDRVYRLYREGFLQTRIYPILGFYPWRCKICGSHILLHKRKKARRSVHAH